MVFQSSLAHVRGCVRNRDMLELIVRWCQRRPKFRRFGQLFLLAYAFLLRLPSEALPAAAGPGSGQASLYTDGDQIVLELKRRYLCRMWRLA